MVFISPSFSWIFVVEIVEGGTRVGKTFFQFHLALTYVHGFLVLRSTNTAENEIHNVCLFTVPKENVSFKFAEHYFLLPTFRWTYFTTFIIGFTFRHYIRTLIITIQQQQDESSTTTTATHRSRVVSSESHTTRVEVVLVVS